MSEERKQEIALRDWRHLVSTDIAFDPPADTYGYEAALWATGVTVIAMKQFGSYQGSWWAKVQFPNGEVGFIGGYYGSCSGCDAFEAEFGYRDSERPDYIHRLRDFGLSYLSNVSTFDQALTEASEHTSWDTEAASMVDWLRQQGPETTVKN